MNVCLQVCRVHPGEKGKYIKIILSLLQSTSSAVVYECAVTLVGLSQAPTAIRAAANCYCQLLVSQSDNNVKLIVLDRLQVQFCELVLATATILYSWLRFMIGLASKCVMSKECFVYACIIEVSFVSHSRSIDCYMCCLLCL